MSPDSSLDKTQLLVGDFPFSPIAGDQKGRHPFTGYNMVQLATSLKKILLIVFTKKTLSVFHIFPIDFYSCALKSPLETGFVPGQQWIPNSMSRDFGPWRCCVGTEHVHVGCEDGFSSFWQFSRPVETQLMQKTYTRS